MRANISSPTHSLEVEPTPKRIIPRRSRSAGSVNSLHSTRLSTEIQDVEQNILTPIRTPKSFLNDTTSVVEPKRKSWWKRLGENTIQNLSFLHEDQIKEMDEILNDYEQGVQNNQENKSYDLGLPESSSNETIESIVIPQRRLFNQKENTLQNKFENVVEKESSQSKQQQSQSEAHEMQLVAPTIKPHKNMPVFPAALLNVSSNVTNKSQELLNLGQKTQLKNLFCNRSTNRKTVFTNLKLIESEDESLNLEPKVRTKNLFGNCVTNMRNNRFSGLIATESDDDIPSIQPKIFEFQKPSKRRRSSTIQADALSPSLSLTSETEFNNWKMLPSSTMVEDNVSEKNTPAKKLRLTRASYTNSEYQKSSNTKSSPSITKLLPETNKASNINENIYDIGNQGINHGCQSQVVDKNKSNIALSKNDSIQPEKTNLSIPTEVLFVNKNSNETEEQNSEARHENNFSSINKNGTIIRNDNYSKTIEKEDFNNIISVEKINANNNTLSLTFKENSHCIIKKDEIGSNNLNEQSVICNPYSSVVDNTKINLVIDKETKNDNTGMENLHSDEQIIELQQDNRDIEILKVMKFDDNLCKSKAGDVNNALKYADSETNILTEHKEINEKPKYDERKLVSQNEEQKIPEKEMHTENETISEIQSVLQDEISEKEQSYQKSEIEKSRTLVEDEENSSMECNVDSPVHINSDGDDNKSVDNNENSCNRNCTEEESKHSNRVMSSESKIEANRKIIVEQTPEDVIDTSKHDSNEVNKLDETKIRSPEAVLNVSTHDYSNKTLLNRSSFRNTNFIERATLRPSFFSMRDSLNLQNDGSKNSTAEGSGWDSHRTIRKTLRQTFGKDFTFRKSLRTLVMEKSAKRHTNVESNDVNEINNISPEKSIEHNDIVQQCGDVDVSVNQNFSEPTEFNEVKEFSKKIALLDKDKPPQKSDTGNQPLNIITSANEAVIVQNNESKCLHNSSQKDDLAGDPSLFEDVADANQIINEYETTIEDKAVIKNNSINEKQNDATDQNYIAEGNGSAVHCEYDNENEPTNENYSVDEDEEVEGSNSFIENESGDEKGKSKENDSNNENDFIEENASVEENETIHENEFTLENGSINEDEAPDLKSITENMSDDGENEYEDENESTKENELTADDELSDEHEHSEENESDNECLFTEKLGNENEIRKENETADERLFTVETKYKSNEFKKKQTQTLLIQYMEKIKEKNIERNNLIREKVLNELQAPVRDSRGIDLYRPKPTKRIKSLNEPPKKGTRIRSLPFRIPPKELLEDLNYKPRKPFKPGNAPWINKRLYKFLESKLEPKYDYRAPHRSEKFTTYLYKFTQEFKRDKVYPNEAIKQLKQEMARLNIVETHYDFYVFCREYLPKEVRIKIIPDIVNKLPLPRRGVYSEILVNQQ